MKEIAILLAGIAIGAFGALIFAAGIWTLFQDNDNDNNQNQNEE